MAGVHIIEVPAYIGAQMVGAITSSYALRLILASVASEGATLHTGSDAQSLALEIIITFILMFVVSAVATDTRAVSSSSSSSHTHSRPNSPLVHQVQKSLSSNHTLHLALAVQLRLLLCSSLVPLKIFSKVFRKLKITYTIQSIIILIEVK
jgi:glycerol uptake facilitator-like aquaporin